MGLSIKSVFLTVVITTAFAQTTPYVETCFDDLPNCQGFIDLNDGFCARYKVMAAKCRLSCGICTPRPTEAGTTIGAGAIPSGWQILLKGVTEVPGDLYQIWSDLGPLNADDNQTQDLTASYPAHYKSFHADRFEDCRYEKIRVAMYRNGVEKASITFDAVDANKTSWFAESRIESSSWPDEPGRLRFENSDLNRQFEVHNTSSFCSSEGWMFVSTKKGGCNFQTGVNGFHYASETSASLYSVMEKADVFVILAKGGVCNNTDPIPLSCPHNGRVYVLWDEWQEGCDRKCICTMIEGSDSTATYCHPLCPSHYKDVKQGCWTEKKEGECCASLVGPTCYGGQGCWDVFTNETRYVGEKWKHGCEAKCLCEKIDEGFATKCTDVCLKWNTTGYDCKPTVPRPGKCCAAPSCPNGIEPIPDDYKDDY